MTDEPTCEGSVSPSAEELLRDAPKRCECCGKVMTREELKAHPHLCATCAAVIDAQTEERLEEDHFGFGWFE
jgi:acetyl-CoA carboxylase beta subunit